MKLEMNRVIVRRGIAMGSLLLLSLGAIGCSADAKDKNGVSSGLGSKSATKDVTDLSLTTPDVIGSQYVNGTISNNSSKRSNYSVTISLESSDGSVQYDTLYMTAMNLEPKQSAQVQSTPTIGKSVPADAKIVVKEVQRTAA